MVVRQFPQGLFTGKRAKKRWSDSELNLSQLLAGAADQPNLTEAIGQLKLSSRLSTSEWGHVLSLLCWLVLTGLNLKTPRYERKPRLIFLVLDLSPMP